MKKYVNLYFLMFVSSFVLSCGPSAEEKYKMNGISFDYEGKINIKFPNGEKFIDSKTITNWPNTQFWIYSKDKVGKTHVRVFQGDATGANMLFQTHFVLAE